jgi:serine/threonine protein kinase
MTPAGPGPGEDVWLTDAAIGRLRALADHPDFSGTRYDVIERIGSGGMGLVFRGHDRELDRDVAIKVTAYATDADAERLRTEARTLARLEHPGIVAVHDVGRLPDGRVFTVMMLVRGERLDVRAARVALADRLRLFDRICDAVSFANDQGIVHGDLKPANIMVGAHGEVLVVDWGGGRTAGYAAPESSQQRADARVDVYALGRILHDLLPDAGGRPLRPLRSIVGRASDTDAAARYPTVADLAADVRRFMDGGAVAAHPESMAERAARLARTYRTPIALVLAYLVMRALLLMAG